MSYEIQALHSIEGFPFRRTLIAMHTIRENPCNSWLKNLLSKPATADSRITSQVAEGANGNVRAVMADLEMWLG